MFRFKQFAVRQDRCPMKVGTARVAVRHGDGVVRNELRAVVPVVEPLEQLAQRPAIK